MHILS